jgi:hypothetical protein
LDTMKGMSAVIEMHDSECLAIELNENGDGVVLLDAYVHRGDGDPLVSPHEGGMQRIRMSIAGMARQGEAGELPADIYEGSLIVGTDVQDNIVRFPAVYNEPICLSMTLSPGARVVVVSGNRLSVEPEGEFRFVETVDFS